MRIRPLLASLAVLLSACSPFRFFYYPNRQLFADPERLGWSYRFLTYSNGAGQKLYAVWFPAEGPPKGVVVHFHGNFGNLSNHFPESHFLTRYGFDVLVFDYEGFGGSTGRPTPAHTVADGLATVRLAASLNRNPAGGVAVFGQSLGAAVATVVAAKDPEVRAAVLEAGFASYPSMAREVLKRSIWGWPLYPFYPLLLTRRWDPERYIGAISPRPVLLIHGTEDRVVPVRFVGRLYDAANAPKDVWQVSGAGHLQCRAVAGAKYERRVADFLTAAMAPRPAPAP